MSDERRVLVKVPNREPRGGRIVGESRDGQSWQIVLDRNSPNTRYAIHKSYCQRMAATTDASTKEDGK